MNVALPDVVTAPVTPPASSKPERKASPAAYVWSKDFTIRRLQ